MLYVLRLGVPFYGELLILLGLFIDLVIFRVYHFAPPFFIHIGVSISLANI